jgi:hypothetical protein
MMMIVIVLFFLGLSMVGTISVAAGSISSSSQIGEGGGKELQGGVRPQQRPQLCGSSSSGVTDGTNATTPATGIAGANNNNTAAGTTTSLYENPEYGIQILCPENWVYLGQENPFTGDFQVVFTSLTEVVQSQRTGEIPSTVSVAIRQLPSTNLDLQVFADLNIQDLTSIGYEIISTSLNATALSGMPAFEVVYVDSNGTMFLQDWTIQGDRAYGVVYGNHESRFEQFLPIARDMISSFAIASETTTLTGDEGNATTASLNTSNTATQSRSSEPSASITSTIEGNQSNDLEAARQQYLTVWNQTEFHIPLSTYVEPEFDTAYGIYQERGSNIFRPGETMVLYSEPVAFGHQRIIDDNGNTLYLMNFTADIIIVDANDGNELATVEDLTVGSMISHLQNTELHLTLTVTQDSPFPVGDYIITYIVHDQVSGESFQIEKGITIADNGDGNASSTATQDIS